MFQALNKFSLKIYLYIKKKKDRFLKSLLKPFAQMGIMADSISILGLLSGIASAISMHYSQSSFLAFWSGKRFFDMADGTMAKLNKNKIFRKIDVDSLSDILFSIVLFLATVPIVGFILPTICLILYLLHLMVDFNRVKHSVFAPQNNYAQFLIILGLVREGVVLQILFNSVTFLLSRVNLIRGATTKAH